MKKKIFIFTYLITLLSLLLLSNTIVKANNHTYTLNSEQIESHFEGLSDDMLVVSLPDGGIIYSNTGVLNYTPEEIKRWNGEIQTIAEVKEEYEDTVFVDKSIGKELNSNTMFRGASPGGEYYMLKLGHSYRSKEFSDSGWRFSGFMFYPEPGTGPYLSFRCFVDSGRIGNFTEAMKTAQGYGILGEELYAGPNWQLTYIGASITNANNAKGFYTYNPIPGTYYEVKN